MPAPVVVFHRSFGVPGFLEFSNRRSPHPSSSSADLRLLPHRRPPSASPSSSPSASPLPSPSSPSFCCLSPTRRSLLSIVIVVVLAVGHRLLPCRSPLPTTVSSNPPSLPTTVSSPCQPLSPPALLPCGPAVHRLLKSSSIANHRFIQSSSPADHLLLLSTVPTARKTSADSISIPHSEVMVLAEIDETYINYEKNPPPLDEDDIVLLKTYVSLQSPNFLYLPR
ncbi:hypothetical protein ACLOJK_040940 [Asimina triloba]